MKNTNNLNGVYYGPKWLLSSDIFIILKTTVLAHQNNRLIISDNRGKFGFEIVHVVDIDQSERFLK